MEFNMVFFFFQLPPLMPVLGGYSLSALEFN